MEQDKNNRLDELFNQAKNEPSKVSFDEIKGQFIKSNVGAGNVSTGSKLFQITNLKIIVMISTLSIIVAGAFLFIGNNSEQPIENERRSLNNEFVDVETEIVVNEYRELVTEHFKKVKLLPANLKGLYRLNKKMALKLRELPKDSVKKALKSQVVSKRNQELLDTAYRFPNLGYEEITANNRQKITMFGKAKKQKSKRTKSKKNNTIGVEGRNDWYQPDPKGFVFIPMGTYDKDGKKISVQAFYMKQTEVTNLEYRTFLFDLLINGKKNEFLIAKPDQKMWVKEYPSSFNQPMVDNYFSHPAYDEYPVVGMSREGAKMYCQWFTEELGKITGIAVNDVRIPTNYEWEWAASGGGKWSPYPWGGPYIRNSKGCFLANFRPMKDNYKADGAFHTAKVNSYNPNEFGLYCMSGNVAEMVYYQDDNKLAGTKGGSWTSVGQELQILDGKDRFKGQTTPSCNIGFRPVLTYLGRSRKAPLEGINVTPPGTKKIDYNLFVDEAEVTNFAWVEYLHWQEKTFGKESQEFKNALPDTTIWNVKVNMDSPYTLHYLKHPAYRSYPVVGVSYEQAIAYCKWRTDRVQELFDIQKQKDKKSIYPKSFEYRLPTKEEWERVARVGNSLKTIKKLEGAKYSGQKTSNLKRGKGNNMGVAGNLNDNADITAPVISYWPNKYGLYNLIGNVAEMTSVKGIAKGGSWKHQEKEVGIEKDFKYTGPKEWLGFRCVFVIND